MRATPTSDAPSATAPCGWSAATLQGFRAGEPAALRDVYRTHVAEVARLLQQGFSFESSGRAHRFTGYDSAFDLQDALHETFRRAFEPAARMGFDGIRPYGPYLRMIARNVVLAAFRRQRKTFPLADGAADHDDAVVVADHAPSAEQGALQGELRAHVRAFLDTLAPGDRELLTVRFVEGMSQRDAAARLGLGRQQIRGREAKLRAALLDHLRRHDAAASHGATLGALACVPLLDAALAGWDRLVAEALR